jgi:hypothetical protein
MTNKSHGAHGFLDDIMAKIFGVKEAADTLGKVEGPEWRPGKFNPGTLTNGEKPLVDTFDKTDKSKTKLQELIQKMKDMASTGSDQASKDLRDKFMSDFNDMVKSTSDELIKNFSKLGVEGTSATKKLQSGVAELGNEIRTMTDKFLNFVGVFDRVKREPAVSGGSWIRRLQKQVKEEEKWNEALNEIRAKGVLSTDLMNKMTEMGPGYAKQMQKVAGMSGSQLSKVAELWGTKSDISQDVGARVAVSQYNRKQAADKIINLYVTGNTISNDSDVERTANQIMSKLRGAGIY